MIAVACGLLAFGVVAFLISPLLDGRRRQSAGRQDLEDLNKRKDFLYTAIRELNIDYSMGKISAEDYRQLQAEYMQEASAVLDRIEQSANGRQSAGVQVEQAVLEIRRKRVAARQTPAGGAAVPAAPADTPAAPAEETVCDQCGKANDAGANFCIECGAPLKQMVCAACGTANRPQAKFCAHCGQKVSDE
jgi:membrane protease subunit (stomatin/prohibitin family)